MTSQGDVFATIFFLQRNEVWQTTKSYNLAFESDTVPPSNIKTETLNNVLVRDLRGIEHNFTFERNGFAVLEVESAMTYKDFDDIDSIKEVYCREMGQCLLDYMQAVSVQIFDVQVMLALQSVWQVAECHFNARSVDNTLCSQIQRSILRY